MNSLKIKGPESNFADVLRMRGTIRVASMNPTLPIANEQAFDITQSLVKINSSCRFHTGRANVIGINFIMTEVKRMSKLAK